MMLCFSRISPAFDRIAYAVLRRIGIADRSLVFCCSTDKLAQASVPCPSGWEIVELPLEKSELLLDCNSQFEWPAFRTLTANRFRCFTIQIGEDIKGYAWIGLGEIPPEHNCNGHKWTGLPIHLDSQTAYLFAAYVAPSSRGQRIYPCLVSHIATILNRDGIRRLSLTTDKYNLPATKAVTRMGFVKCGETRFTAFAFWKRATYEIAPSFMPSNVGKYVGDYRSR